MVSHLKLSKVERRRLTIFLVCLIMATIAWSFFALSGYYVCRIRVPIRYVHTPQKKALRPLQVDTVDLQVEDTGWQIMLLKMRTNLPSIVIDTKDLDEKNYIVLNNQLKHIGSQLKDHQKVVHVFPDTLFFGFYQCASKRVPVQLVHHLSMSRPYGIAGKIRINPNYVTLTGPLEELNSIQVCQTETLKMGSVNHSIAAKLPLRFASKVHFGVRPDGVEVQIPVDEFTEKVVEVPLKILNNSNYNEVNLFPQKVKITFLTALSSYAQLNSEFFEAGVDLNKWRQHGYKQLPVVLSRFPDYCKLVRVEPEHVDFIVNK